MDELKRIKERITDEVLAQMGDLKSVDVKELGEAIDMIKDLAEAEYYCNVVLAMEEGTDDRHGYPKKKRDIPYRPYVDQEPYVNEYMGWNDEVYPDKGYMYPSTRMNIKTKDGLDGTNRYGKPYNDYNASKKAYTRTNSASDKEEMNMHAKEHISDTITTLQEIWDAADTELKRRMKADIQELLNRMDV